MCSTCGCYNHQSWCPFAETEKTDEVCICDRCGEPIYKGETIYTLGDKNYCICIDDMTNSEFKEFIGFNKRSAE